MNFMYSFNIYCETDIGIPGTAFLNMEDSKVPKTNRSLLLWAYILVWKTGSKQVNKQTYNFSE